MKTPYPPLKKEFEGIDINQLAKQLKTSPSVVYNIKYGNKRVSPERAKKIELVTKGRLTRYMLRRDIYDKN